MHRFYKFVRAAGLIAMVSLAVVGCSKARHLSNANKYYDKGDYDSAELEYIKTLRADPKNVLARKRLGMIFYDEGKMRYAYQVLRQAHELDTNDLDVRLKLGFFYLSAGDLTNAHSEASFVMSRRPEDPAAPQLLADSISSKADVETSRKQLQQLNFTGEKSGPILVALGTLAMREQDFKTAAAEFDQARTVAPKLPLAYAAIANLALIQGDFKSAEENLKTAAELSPPRSSLRLRYYQALMRSGNLADVEDKLAGLVKIAPDYLPARLMLAEIMAANKKMDKCEKEVEEVLRRDPENNDGLILSAKLDEARGDLTNSVIQYEKLVRYSPRDAQAQYLLGLAYRAVGDYTRAAGALGEASTLKTNFVDAILALDEMKIRQGSYEAAIPSLRHLAAQDPKNLRAQLMLAESYSLQGNFNGSVNIYSQLERYFPTNGLLPALKGLVYLQAKNEGDARKAFEQSRRLSPDYLPPLEKLVDLDIADKQYAAAFQRVQAQIDRTPAVLELLLLQAKIYEAQGDNQKAESVLSGLIEKKPDMYMPYMQLSLLYENTHQPQKALDVLHKMLEKNSKDISSWMRVGMLEDGQKNYTAARDAYQKVIEINPHFLSALNNLSYIYSEKLKDLDKAYDVAKQARDLTSSDPSTAPYAADTLGWVLYRKGDYAQALPLEQESARTLGALGEVQYHLGMVNYMLDDEAAATDALQRAAQSKDTFNGKDEIAVRLATLSIDTKAAGADARADLEKRVAEAPHDGVAQSRLAAIYQRDGATDKAIAAYEAVIQVNPGSITALFNLAQLYSMKPDQHEKAYTLAKSLYKLSPGDANVEQLVGRLAMQSGDSRYAMGLFQAAARQRSGDPELQYDLAKAAYSEGQVADAISALQSALQAHGTFSRAAEAKRFLDMASLASDPTQAVAAAAQVEQALKAQPDYVPALMAQGLIDEQKSDVSGAKAAFEKVLTHYPDFVPAKRELVILYAQEAGDDTRAYDLGVKAREAYPNDPDVLKAMGIIAYRQADYVNAARHLKLAAIRKSTDPVVFYYLGMTDYQTKDTDESKKNLTKALKLTLPDKLAAEARRVLAEK